MRALFWQGAKGTEACPIEVESESSSDDEVQGPVNPVRASVQGPVQPVQGPISPPVTTARLAEDVAANQETVQDRLDEYMQTNPRKKISIIADRFKTIFGSYNAPLNKVGSKGLKEKAEAARSKERSFSEVDPDNINPLKRSRRGASSFNISNWSQGLESAGGGGGGAAEEHLGDGIVVAGYEPFIIDRLSKFLKRTDICLEKPVESICFEATSKKIIVVCGDGSLIRCDKVICATPVPQVKVLLKPVLSEHQFQCLDTIHMGNESKVFLVLDQDIVGLLCKKFKLKEKDTFYFNLLADMRCIARRRPASLGQDLKSEIIVMINPVDGASSLDNGTDFDKARIVRATIEEAIGIKLKVASWIVTDWISKKYTGEGSYSYWGPGCGKEEVKAAFTPVRNPNTSENAIFFAGEACSVDAGQTVRDAVETGEEAARRLAFEVSGHAQGSPEQADIMSNSAFSFFPAELPLITCCQEADVATPPLRLLESPDVVIIGGGAAGLAAAASLELLLPRAKVTLVEADDRLGGRIKTKNGFDYGASFIHGCDGSNPLWRLAQQEGIAVDTTDGGYSKAWGPRCVFFSGGKKVNARKVQGAHKEVDKYQWNFVTKK